MITKELLKEYIPFWDKLSQSEQQLLCNKVIKQSAKKGTVIHNGESDCLGLLVVTKGQFWAYTVSDEGKAISLFRLFDHDLSLFTASCVMSNIEFEVVIEAREEVEYLVIPANIFHDLMNTSLPVANYTNQLMGSIFSDVMWVMEQVLNKSFDKRLAGFLVEETEITGNAMLKMTHEEIAQHLGTAREVVTRMLKYFQTEEIVALSRGCVAVIDEARLRDIAQESLR